MPKVKVTNDLLNVDLMIKVRSAKRTDFKRDMAVKRLVGQQMHSYSFSVQDWAYPVFFNAFVRGVVTLLGDSQSHLWTEEPQTVWKQNSSLRGMELCSNAASELKCKKTYGKPLIKIWTPLCSIFTVKMKVSRKRSWLCMYSSDMQTCWHLVLHTVMQRQQLSKA